MRTVSAASALLILIGGCAEPRPPLGGPTDKAPPALVASEPANESVSIRPEFIRLTFSDYLDEASFTQAFSITPPLSGRPRLKWRGRSVTIRFDDAWRDSTTYVVTLDTQLRNWRGVGLLQPIIMAFATGPVIDQGRIRGRALEALRGESAEGLNVFAYPTSDIKSSGPAYVTSTGENGQFDLSYVREADYHVIVLQDANRNQEPDPSERFAVPPQIFMPTVTDTTAQRPVWVVGTLDSLAPAIDRIRAISGTRLSVRFTESVMMPQREPNNWSITDSLTRSPRAVQQVYSRIDDPQVIYLRTDSLDERTWSLSADPTLSDSSGNGIIMDPVWFNGRARDDTTQLRFLGFLPDRSESVIGLGPLDYPGLRFNQPVADSLMFQIVQVTDSLGAGLAFGFGSDNGSFYSVDAIRSPGDHAIIKLELPGASFEQAFRRLTERELGSLSGIVIPGGDSVRVELLSELTGRLYVSEQPDHNGAYMFEGLPEEAFMIRAFIDQNGNGRWDAGAVDPYMAREPISWVSEPLTVRPRWDSASSDTLFLNSIGFAGSQ